jgi:ribosomal protein S18 acetylase RimI-like enzyme
MEHNHESLSIDLKLPTSMSEAERQAFQRQIEIGGEVTPAGLSRRIEAAHMLSYVLRGDNLVAVGAVKRPDDAYVERLSQSAGYDLGDCGAELGWIYVTPEAQGRHLGSRLSSALCESFEHSIFSTTRINNASMQAILRKLDFKRVGEE